MLFGGQGGVRIGDNLLMRLMLLQSAPIHGIRDPNLLIRVQPEIYERVDIEDNCSIGTGVTLLAASRVAGSVIAAGSFARGEHPALLHRRWDPSEDLELAVNSRRRRDVQSGILTVEPRSDQ
jgi:hypothetical protein